MSDSDTPPEPADEDFAALSEEMAAELGASDPEPAADDVDGGEDHDPDPEPGTDGDMGGGGPGGMGGMDPMDAMDDAGITPGDIYCRGLGIGTAVTVDRFDPDDPRDRDEVVEDYYGLAKELWLDEYFNQVWRRRMGNPENMTPEESLMFATVAFVGMAGMQEHNAAMGAAGHFGGDDA